MFDLPQRHNENTCFRCGEKIESAAELSIEHKQPWLDVSANLFWDLSNVALSHGRCNTVDRHYSIKTRKIGLEGEAWRNGRKAFLPVAAFVRARARWNGLAAHCRTCKKEQRGRCFGSYSANRRRTTTPSARQLV
ncbi:MAG: HNH endonuclease [Acidobacteria bacterium]|nr:HNH endonuclease [Acidobacteriota bacterium]